MSARCHAWVLICVLGIAQGFAQERRFVLTKKEVLEKPIFVGKKLRKAPIKICGSENIAGLITVYLNATTDEQVAGLIVPEQLAKLPPRLRWEWLSVFSDNLLAIERETKHVAIYSTFRFSKGSEQLYFVSFVPDAPRDKEMKSAAKKAILDRIERLLDQFSPEQVSKFKQHLSDIEFGMQGFGPGLLVVRESGGKMRLDPSLEKTSLGRRFTSPNFDPESESAETLDKLAAELTKKKKALKPSKARKK